MREAKLRSDWAAIDEAYEEAARRLTLALVADAVLPDLLQEIADPHHATPRQVALRFLVRFPLTFAIPKTSKPAHVVENAGQPELRLTADDISRIDQAFPRGPRPRELPML